ncbi:pyridoxal phosphate-dependent aminotransferase [Calidifontibacter sp. DB0510]|uniref:Pyridoxal phosphate-dependent aminotransferase n=1 Tax=Metallococcus carri TaxID=1656884 RepID=A0A967E8L8_9MICO|nr:pyridoxal phosphate-dependent aminotransferase [Metallococcus carri]NHN54330.1 pyridoxal phosphate-dependent aminotransferase [Metallococcus carri]NOP36830.1 pyridoxal phosphate-dependent aminotransferase [Calidifontibacter sp. DB2511S]
MDSPLVARMQGFGETVFAEMTQRAAAAAAVNLGQGFPDTDGPPEVLSAAVHAIEAGENQYPPGIGIPALREAIAEHQARFWGLSVDPATEVLVTVGATEAIAATILALCEVGDEVVTFEPYYDSYAASIALAGAVRRTSVLRFPDFAVDEDSLRAAFSPRTKLVLLNTPHNPTGKVFTRAELDLIAALAREHDAWVVTDEVYEHLVYDGAHLPIASLPGMPERTLTISSGGKTFATTGWKVGWVHGPVEAISAVRTVKQFLTFVGSGPFQPAIAAGLRLPNSYFTGFAESMRSRRDLLVGGLRDLGLSVAVPAGGYFVIADCSPWGADALALCRELPTRVGVAAVPVSAFHDSPSAATGLVRFAFCKQRSVLEEGLRRLSAMATLSTGSARP